MKRLLVLLMIIGLFAFYSVAVAQAPARVTGNVPNSLQLGSAIQLEAEDASANMPFAAPPAQISAQAVISSVTLTASKDAFLNERSPDNNTGGHTHVAAGRDGTGNIRRGVIAFDVAGNIPAGSAIVLQQHSDLP